MATQSGSMRVHLIGSGLIGTSLGLALRRLGWPVTLEDASPTSAALARDLGAGDLGDAAATDAPAPDVVVVATPPDVAASVIASSLERFPEATVTDVASVKGAVLRDLAAACVDTGRYVGAHPMAGREKSGAIAARADLFEGRAWVVCPHPGAPDDRVAQVRALGAATGAAVVDLPADEHDAAVAAVSHVPQIAASVVAARLEGLPETAVGLAGQGLRDVTRIAASDPQLWTQILAGNAPAVGRVLDDLIADLQRVRDSLGSLAAERDSQPVAAQGARGTLARMIADGNAGQARIPGKHGAAPTQYAVVSVLVPDTPGQLGRLLQDMGEAGVNLEEIHLDHGLGMPYGVADISVVPAAEIPLQEALAARGWRLHS
ncbi:MAG: prephenate dehydrogenase [Micrococcales bacterium]|nr:prephenate dehydrogenase [Micrococcales bacterium]